MKINPDMMPVMVSAIDADGMSMSEISELTDTEILSEIESLEGVASVTAQGMIEESVHVVLKQDKIDEINEKISDALDAKFEEAGEEISNAEEKLESGKSQLNKQKEQVSGQLASAENAVTDGKIEVAKGEVQLATAKQQLELIEEVVKAAEAQLITAKAALAEAEAELAQKEEQYNQLIEAKGSLEKQIQDIINDTNMSKEEKDQAIAALQTQLDAANSALAESQITSETLDALRSSVASVREQVESLEAQITGGYTQIAAAKAQIEQAESDLAAGKEVVNSKLSEINAAKFKAENGFDTADAEIQKGEDELDSAKEQYEQGKETAYESADLDNILTADMLSGILTAQNFSMPAGYVPEDGVDYLVRVGEKLQSTEELENLLLLDLSLDGVEPIRLKDVAEVTMVDNSLESYSKINGNDGVMLMIQKQTDYSTAEVSDRVKAKFAELEEVNTGLHITNLMDQGIYIDMVIDSVLENRCV